MSEQIKGVRVWDPLIRIGHWLVVVAFFTAYFTEEEFLTLHSWAGYVVAAVVAIRIIWGFVGPPTARFRNFVRSPRKALAYLRLLIAGRPPKYLGHNPAGGLMIVLMLLSLLGTAGSGMVIYAIEEGAGPLAPLLATNTGAGLIPISAALADEDDEEEEAHEHAAAGLLGGEEFWEEIHEVLANFTLALVILHVLGVVASSLASRENLVRAMVTGRKKALVDEPTAPTPREKRPEGHPDQVSSHP
ncbi:MAG: cytochrome b/b6 domain-containing protein [Xanthomonadales bacterium]|nr:cytochrome b/b6 domain-containing protein [Xanthomonadales bacterium]